MSIDPNEVIQHKDIPQPISLDLGDVLQRLANAEPSTDAPYLTVELNWQLDGANPNKRPARQFVNDSVVARLSEFEERTFAHTSLSADLDLIGESLDGGIDPVTQGVVIVACSAQGIYEVVQLGVPVENRVTFGPIPALGAMARVLDDQRRFALLAADQREAILLLVSQSRVDHRVDVSGTEHPGKHQVGWSESRYQRSSEERLDAFAKVIADETRRLMDEQKIDSLVLAGDDSIVSELMSAFHQTVQDRIVGKIRREMHEAESALVDAALPVVEQAEREQEMAQVTTLRDAVAAGGRGAAGPVDVITALQAGQVQTLLLTDDFDGPGWADYSLPVYGAGERPNEHPAGGDPANLVDIEVGQEAIRLALQTGATVEVISTSLPVMDSGAEFPRAEGGAPRSEAALALDSMGGIGAILRFVLDNDQPIADL